jgi:signal transduction histidine kinase
MTLTLVRHLGDLAAGGALLGAVVVVWRARHSRLTVALGLAGAAWFAGSLWPSLSFAHRGPLVATLVVTRFDRIPTVWKILIAMAAVDGASTPIANTGWCTVALGVTLVVFAFVGARPTHLARVGGALAAFAGCVFMSLGALRLSQAALDGWPEVGYDLAVIALAATVAGAVVHRPFQRFVVELQQQSPADALADTLRRTFADPTLQVRIGLMDSPIAGPRVTPLMRGNTCVGVLHHEPLVAVEPSTIDGLTRIAGLVCDAELTGRAAQQALDELAASSRLLAEIREQEAAALAGRVRAGALPPLDAAIAVLHEHPIAQHLRTARGDIVSVAEGLVATTLTARGLRDAIAERAAVSPIPVDVHVDLGASALTLRDNVSHALLLVCSEAVTNAIKHARASSIAVRLHLSTSLLELSITDDGQGGADPSGLGLRGVADRVSAFGGHFAVESVAGAGTSVTVTAPSAAVVS